MNGFLHATLTFAGQNYGAKKIDRIKKVILFSEMQVVAIGASVGIFVVLFAEPLVSLYIGESDPNRVAVMNSAVEIITFIQPFYFMLGAMNALSGALRGIGHPTIPTVVSIAGICGFRSLWVVAFLSMQIFNSIIGLFVCYPISWALCIIAMITALVILLKRMKKKFVQEAA